MAFDSFSLYAMLPNLQDQLVGRVLRDVDVHGRHEILLTFRRREDEKRGPCLLMSAHPSYARVHLIGSAPKSGDRTHFVSVLGTHLFRRELIEVSQKGLDRILVLRFAAPFDPLAKESGERLLIAETMGKHSNLILVDGETGRIIEAMKHVDESRNRHREVLPAVKYVPPPVSERHNPFELSEQDFEKSVDPTDPAPTWKQILRLADGFGPTLAQHVVATCEDPASSASLWRSYSELVRRIRRRDVEPCVVFAHGESGAKPLAYALFPPAGGDLGRIERFAMVSDALDTYHGRLQLSETIEQARHRLSQALAVREERLHKKHDARMGDKAVSDEADTYRLHGDLLMASLHDVPERDDVAHVPNLYDPDAPLVDIALDPSKSALANAQGYFRRYKKARRAAHRIAQLIADLSGELEDVAEMRARLDALRTLDELQRLEEEFVTRGWIRVKQSGRRTQEAIPYRIFTMRGWRLLVGRNERENEWLITRVARKDDVWLHAKQIPGSHVIISNPERKEQVPMPVLLAAAKLAAHFSKARNSSHVPVDYTRVRYVVRPKGAAAGFVTYSREKTLSVQPAPPSEIFRDESARSATPN